MGTQAPFPAAPTVSLTAAPVVGDDSKEGSHNKAEGQEQNSSEDDEDGADGEDDAGAETKRDNSEAKSDFGTASRGRGRKQSKRQPIKRDRAQAKSTASTLHTKRKKQSGFKHNTPSESVVPLDDTKEAMNDTTVRDDEEKEGKEGKSSDGEDENSTAEADEDSQQGDTEATVNVGKKRTARGQRKHKHSPKRSVRSAEHSSTEEDNVTAEHKEQDSTEEKQSAQQNSDDEKSEEKDRTDGSSEEEKDVMAEDGDEKKASPIRRTSKRKASVAGAKTTPTKRRSRGNREQDRQENARLHDAVSEGATLSLHPFVLNALQYEDEGAQLQRVYNKGDGSCMLNSVLMGMNNGVHPTAEQVRSIYCKRQCGLYRSTHCFRYTVGLNRSHPTGRRYFQRQSVQLDVLERPVACWRLAVSDVGTSN